MSVGVVKMSLRSSAILAGIVAFTFPVAAQDAPSTKHQVTIKSYAFTPPKIVVKEGDVIEWNNTDLARHDAKASDRSWSSGDIKGGEKKSVKMTKVGTFAYMCSFHSDMSGTVVVEAAAPAPAPSVPGPAASTETTGVGLLAKASMIGIDGAEVGSADLIQTAKGVLVKLTMKGLTPGEHAFHVHGVGKCEAPFTTAGGHFNPHARKHGFMAGEGHAGDMPNLHVPQSGEIAVEVLNTAITLEKDKVNSVFSQNGTALIVHAGRDDYKTDPTGEAGGRIACGVIK